MARQTEKSGREIEQLRVQRNLKLSVEERLNQGTINPHRPGIDDGPKFRVFKTMAEYKAWQETLPQYLGYWKVEEE